MNKKKALTIAIEAIEKRIQNYAFDAAMYDVYKADYPHAFSSSQKKKELLEAKEILEKMKSE